MKKYLLVMSITTYCIFIGNTAFCQSEETNGCPQKELVRRYIELQDSLARFFTHIKKTNSEDSYKEFELSFGAGDSTAAFQYFGSRSSGLTDSINALTDSLKLYTSLLRTAIDPNSSMSNLEFTDTLSSRMACVVADTTINSLDYLIEQCFGTGSTLREAGDLGCIDDFRAALTSARASYLYSNGTCASGVGCPGWWRLACIGACLLANYAIYDQNKWDAYCDYMSCLGRSCPSF